MAIVNVNDDSFSGDGTLDVQEAVAMAKRHLQWGADIIDVGAESARTNRKAVTVEEEVRRFLGFLDLWDEVWPAVHPRDQEQVWPPVLSANTWRPDVVRAVLETGKVELVNDMGALPDDRNARLCAAAGAALVVMHSVGEPKVAHFQQQWTDVVASMLEFFDQKIRLCMAAGLSAESLILDPGVDFAKQKDDNLRVYRELERLTVFGRPLLVPVSRKTVIGDVLDLPNPVDRDAGTIACIAAAQSRGAALFRVHNTDAAWQAVKALGRLQRE